LGDGLFNAGRAKIAAGWRPRSVTRDQGETQAGKNRVEEPPLEKRRATFFPRRHLLRAGILFA
jgi:hypothetical protein